MRTIRICFVTACVVLGGLLASASLLSLPLGMAAGLVIGVAIVAIESLWIASAPAAATSVIGGLLAGGVVARLFASHLLVLTVKSGLDLNATAKSCVVVIFYCLCCYIGVAVFEHLRKNYEVVLPFIRLIPREGKGQELILDSSAVIDGRILEVLATGVIDNPIIIPEFVIEEVQKLADHGGNLKRARGRRGLEILRTLAEDEGINSTVINRDFPELNGVDEKLVKLAQHRKGKLLTDDYNLNQVAKVHGIPVINFNDLAMALKPVVLPGEVLNVKLIREGEEPDQAVGYLADGTMVVCAKGKSQIGNSVDITVSSALQTSAGRMIFGRIE
ncbi:PIN/TRAM domain-containing protein [Planctomycetota bacterium]